MQLTDSQYNLHGIKAYCLLIESFLCLKHFVELAASDKWHHKVESRLRLKQEFHPNKERVICSKQNFFFQLG